ncbi:hypothetical protein D3C75_1136590 [compost metagenome]
MGVTQGQHAGVDGVFAQIVQVLQVAEAGQGVGQARHRGFRQAAARRQFLVTQVPFAGPEATQQLQATRQGGDELAVRLQGLQVDFGVDAFALVHGHSSWIR